MCIRVSDLQFINERIKFWFNILLILFAEHIASMYLIAALKQKISVSFNVEYLNLTASLFLFTIKYYYHIFYNLWNRGRLDDWENEFLMEK